MTTATEIATTVQIQEVSNDTGRDGPQWRLKVRWPWTNPNPHFSDTLWLDVSDFPTKPTIAAHNVIAVKTNIKTSKGDPHDGSREWMWNYRIISFNGSPSGTMPEPARHLGHTSSEDVENLFSGPDDRAQEPAPERPNGVIKVEGVVQGHLEKLAVDLYIMEGQDSLHLNGTVDYLRIREIRDGFFHHVKEHSIMPEHHCYAHDVGRNKSSKDEWYHKFGEAWCVEGKGLLDAAGEPVTDAGE